MDAPEDVRRPTSGGATAAALSSPSWNTGLREAASLSRDLVSERARRRIPPPDDGDCRTLHCPGGVDTVAPLVPGSTRARDRRGPRRSVEWGLLVCLIQALFSRAAGPFRVPGTSWQRRLRAPTKAPPSPQSVDCGKPRRIGTPTLPHLFRAGDSSGAPPAHPLAGPDGLD